MLTLGNDPQHPHKERHHKKAVVQDVRTAPPTRRVFAFFLTGFVFIESFFSFSSFSPEVFFLFRSFFVFFFGKMRAHVRVPSVWSLTSTAKHVLSPHVLVTFQPGPGQRAPSQDEYHKNYSPLMNLQDCATQPSSSQLVSLFWGFCSRSLQIATNRSMCRNKPWAHHQRTTFAPSGPIKQPQTRTNMCEVARLIHLSSHNRYGVTDNTRVAGRQKIVLGRGDQCVSTTTSRNKREHVPWFCLRSCSYVPACGPYFLSVGVVVRLCSSFEKWL